MSTRPPAAQADPQVALIGAYLKQPRLPTISCEYQTLAHAAVHQNAGYLGYLRTLLEHEIVEREERHLQRRLTQARFPYEKRLEDFDFSLVPALRKERLLELAQGTFVAQRENCLFWGPAASARPISSWGWA